MSRTGAFQADKKETSKNEAVFIFLSYSQNDLCHSIFNNKTSRLIEHNQF